MTRHKRAERSLRKSEDRYQTLFRNMSEGFMLGEILLDPQGRPTDLRLLEINEAFETQSGLGRDVLGRPLRQLLPKLEQFWIDRYGAVALSGHSDRFENYNADTGRHYEVYCFSPRKGRFAALFRDITGQKRLEQTLRATQQRYEALFNNRTNGIGHFRVVCDAQGRPRDYLIEKVNAAYERIVGRRREAVEGRLVTEAFPGIENLEFDYIGEFGRIALEAGEGSFEVYFPPTAQWLSLYVYSPQRGEFTVIFTDVTQQKRVQAALRESEDSLRATFDQAAVGITHVGPEGHILRTNRKFCEMVGYSAEELCRMRFVDLTYEPDRDIGLSDFMRALAGELRTFSVEKRYQRKDGVIIWVRITASTVQDAVSGDPKYNVVIAEDITERKHAERRAREAALHDSLTGLPNRLLVFEYATHLLAAASRKHSQGAFLFIDLDRFKPVNDLYGHETGDLLLQAVAGRLNSCVRHEDLVGRLGGDEFVIVLPHLETPHQAATVAQHVIDAVSEPFELGELDVSVTPSIGISLFPQHGTEVDVLIDAADRAMYQAKRSGAGSYRVYLPESDGDAGQSSLVEARLKTALRRGGLALHYQPVVDMRSGRLSGVEALLRLEDGEGGTIGPARFIPIAEASGLIGRLGEWVVTEACRQHAAWREEGLPPIPIAVNVSPLQFRQRSFAQRLVDIVRSSGIDPNCFQIEVTESTVMESVGEAVETLRALKSSGIKVALDDFGTGYSSLSHLSQLPLDKLKVDQSFVQRIEHDRASRAITEAIIALGRMLSLEVVGEGIDSPQALSYLHEHGCDQGQGYLLSRPLGPQEFSTWFRRTELSH